MLKPRSFATRLKADPTLAAELAALLAVHLQALQKEA
jgi:hypothetical protein